MEQSELRAILAAVPLPMIWIARDQKLVMGNAAGEAMFGATAMGRNYGMAIRQPALVEAIGAAMVQGRGNTVQVVRRAETHEVIYRVTVTPFEGGALCAFEDVSEQQQIGQLRRDFVANVSHELRTPLTALLGFIETLQGAAKDDPAARDRFLGIMAREAGRMARLVRDLLSLSRVEAEERLRPDAVVDVAALVRGALASLRPMVDSHGVTLQVEGVDQPMRVQGDADQLVQVVQNLTENAVKYGLPGKLVTLRMERLAEKTGFAGPVVRLQITDQGEGIDPQHLPRLTERFYRVDSHRSREKGGTGLGLAIVKHIVNRHRGRLTIESVKGQGSTFTVVLPLA